MRADGQCKLDGEKRMTIKYPTGMDAERAKESIVKNMPGRAYEYRGQIAWLEWEKEELVAAATIPHSRNGRSFNSIGKWKLCFGENGIRMKRKISLDLCINLVLLVTWLMITVFFFLGISTGEIIILFFFFVFLLFFVLYLRAVFWNPKKRVKKYLCSIME